MTRIYILATSEEALTLLRLKDYEAFMELAERAGDVYSVEGFNHNRPDINNKVIYINGSK